MDAQPFRLLMCRRLHLPLPLSLRTCRCGRRLDSFGHHRAACAEAGVSGRRGFPLECATAQVCREAGARVATNVLVRDMDLAAFNALDSRRLKVVADGLTLWHGAQLAIDTTLIFPLRRDGQHLRRPDNGRSAPTRNSLVMVAGHGWSCWLQKWVADGAARQRSSCAHLPKPGHNQSHCCFRVERRPRGCGGGVRCWHAVPHGPSQCPWWTTVQCPRQALTCLPSRR